MFAENAKNPIFYPLSTSSAGVVVTTNACCRLLLFSVPRSSAALASVTSATSIYGIQSYTPAAPVQRIRIFESFKAPGKGRGARVDTEATSVNVSSTNSPGSTLETVVLIRRKPRDVSYAR